MTRPLVAFLAKAANTMPLPVQRMAARLLWPNKSRTAAALAPRLDHNRFPRVIMGPLNAAGQASAWCRAINVKFPEAQALSLEVVDSHRHNSFAFPTDLSIPTDLHRGRLAWETKILDTFTHALLERGSSVTALSKGVPTARHVRNYAEKGVQAGIVIHGSELRDPRLHAELYRASPFRQQPEKFRRAAERVALTRTLLEESGVPIFVTTADMLDFVPEATLVPVVIDVERFSAVHPVPALERKVPVVLHAPSNPELKGTAAIEKALTTLADAGAIEYRRINGVPSSAMPGLIGEADIVVDQIVLGATGVLAAEAQAAGRLVVAHLHERVRARVGQYAPVVDATPNTIAAVMDDILDRRHHYAAIAARGPAWALSQHDGRASADALAPFLGLRTGGAS